jgi:hypothetical protein
MSKKSGKSGGLKSIPGGNSGRIGGDGTGNGGGDGPQDPTTPSTPISNVIDFTAIRAKRSQDNRRTVERYFLHHMVDAIVELEEGKELSLEIVEASESGCSFRLAANKIKLLPQGQIRTRFYFSRESYLLIGLDIVNSTPEIGTGVPATRFGCKVDSTFASTDAYIQFVRFVEAFSAAASRDSQHATAQ